MTIDRRRPSDVLIDVIAERLHGGGSSTEGHRLLDDRGTDWRRVVDQARTSAVLPAFAAAARDLGLADRFERELGEGLREAHVRNVMRNMQHRLQLRQLAVVLNRARMEPVLLKGAIRLVDGLYPDVGWREMWDLDLLVPEVDLEDAVEALMEAGYAIQHDVVPGMFITSAGHHHYPALIHPGHGVPVEVHTALFPRARQRHLLSAAEVLEGSRRVAVDGVTVRVPSAEHQIVHLVGHRQIGHRGHAIGRIELRDQLEAAALIHWSPEPLGWDAVTARFDKAGHRRSLSTFLLSLHDDGFCSLPMAIRIDALTAIQRRRIAAQRRFAPMMRAGMLAGGYVVELRDVVIDAKARWDLPRSVAKRLDGIRRHLAK